LDKGRWNGLKNKKKRIKKSLSRRSLNTLYLQERFKKQKSGARKRKLRRRT